MNNRRNVGLGGLFTLLLIGGFYLYRNREQVLDFLESRGIPVPEGLDRLRNAIRRGAGRVRERKAG